jgi:hypothetical protein
LIRRWRPLLHQCWLLVLLMLVQHWLALPSLWLMHATAIWLQWLLHIRPLQWQIRQRWYQRVSRTYWQEFVWHLHSSCAR